MLETDVIGHLIDVEHQAASMLLDAQTEADSRIAEAKSKADDMFKSGYEAIISELETSCSEKIKESEGVYSSLMKNFCEGVEKQPQNEIAFYSMLDSLLFGK